MRWTQGHEARVVCGSMFSAEFLSPQAAAPPACRAPHGHCMAPHPCDSNTASQQSVCVCFQILIFVFILKYLTGRSNLCCCLWSFKLCVCVTDWLTDCVCVCVTDCDCVCVCVYGAKSYFYNSVTFCLILLHLRSSPFIHNTHCCRITVRRSEVRLGSDGAPGAGFEFWPVNHEYVVNKLYSFLNRSCIWVVFRLK